MLWGAQKVLLPPYIEHREKNQGGGRMKSDCVFEKCLKDLERSLKDRSQEISESGSFVEKEAWQTVVDSFFQLKVDYQRMSELKEKVSSWRE
jgi:hypothetical protein